jgi:hypothetical protein
MSDRELIAAAKALIDADRAEAWRYPTVWEPVVDRLLQACQALQSGEPVAVADRGVLNWIDGKQFAREADLYTTPQPVVDEAVFDILKAAQGSCRLGFNDIADKQIEIAIKALLSAGKETV